MSGSDGNAASPERKRTTSYLVGAWWFGLTPLLSLFSGIPPTAQILAISGGVGWGYAFYLKWKHSEKAA